jgi:hypothetical protein
MEISISLYDIIDDYDDPVFETDDFGLIILSLIDIVMGM